ncbi:ATP-grasp domain-containing protein [Candidatus Woesearchaeota archaeon]|nr:ATP-grasp domain-containing protein [Candidatus Woesearchaeota archaeon]MBW3005689.1 ATP-grasp domain-containing protein [Candidatus Woesearchaeota archaeon]
MPGTDRSICQALELKGHKVTRLPYTPGKSIKLDKKYDVIFNLCDGLEDDLDFVEFQVLKDIEKTRIPFTGNSLNTIRLCNDKRKIKQVLLKKNILTPNFQVFKSDKQKLRSDMKFPLIIKPVCADAAVGIYADSVVNTEKQLRQRVKRVLVRHKQPAALVSEYIAGRDLTIPVMGNKKIKVLDPTELKYIRSFKNKPNILSYAAKWHKGRPVYKDSITLVKNAKKRFSKEEMKKIKFAAKATYAAVGCSGYATVDARLDEKGNVYVIEINPNCWIGPKSDTALTLQKNYNVDYPGMIDKIVKIAKER